MAQETIFGDGSEDVIGEVVKALESAGVTGDIAAAVTNNLINGGIEVTEEEIDDGLALSEVFAEFTNNSECWHRKRLSLCMLCSFT